MNTPTTLITTGSPWNSGSSERLRLGAVGRARVCCPGARLPSPFKVIMLQPFPGRWLDHLYLHSAWRLNSASPRTPMLCDLSLPECYWEKSMISYLQWFSPIHSHFFAELFPTKSTSQGWSVQWWPKISCEFIWATMGSWGLGGALEE